AHDGPPGSVARGEVAAQGVGMEGDSGHPDGERPRGAGGSAAALRETGDGLGHGGQFYGDGATAARKTPSPFKLTEQPHGSPPLLSAGPGGGHGPALRRLRAPLSKVPPAGLPRLDRLLGLLPDRRRPAGVLPDAAR